MADVSIHRLHKTLDESILASQSVRMKELRLKSLLQDPESFWSTYESEVNQPTDFWHDRLRPPFVQHWLATLNNTGPKTPDGLPSIEQQWVAFLVWLDVKAMEGGDSSHAASDSRSPSPEESVPVHVFKMAALWVDPAVRGQGVARRMINSAIEWSKTQVPENSAGRIWIETEARRENVHAIDLYMRIGFAVIVDGAVFEHEGREERIVKMRLEVHV